jgi:hypothetical protein
MRIGNDNAVGKCALPLPSWQVFREEPGAWVVAPMHSVVHNLSSTAQAADLELRQAGQRPDKLGDCGDQLRKCFSVSLQAPGV